MNLPPIGTWGQYEDDSWHDEPVTRPAVIVDHEPANGLQIAFYKWGHWEKATVLFAPTLTAGHWSPLPAWKWQEHDAR